MLFLSCILCRWQTILLKLLTAQVGGFWKEAGFMVITCHSIFRERKAQNENKELPNEAASDRKSGKLSEKNLSNTNIFQNKNICKNSAVKLYKSKLCISIQMPVPATGRQKVRKVHFKAPSLCFSHPLLSYSLTKVNKPWNYLAPNQPIHAITSHSSAVLLPSRSKN